MAMILPAVRALLHRPAFTTVVVATLALGIGATTAVFSLVYGILLRPFPYPDPGRLVRIESVHTGGATEVARGSSLPDVEDWRRENRTLSDLGAYTTFDADLRGDGPSEAVHMTQLHPGALVAVGVQPLRGRLFLPEEDLPGGDVHKAILGHRLWQSRFGGDPKIIGSTIETSLRSFTVVGVMPPGFSFPGRTEIWTPMESWYDMAVGERKIKRRDGRWYPVVGRLREGVSLAQAQDDLDRVAAALERDHPKDNEAIRTRLTSLRAAEVGPLKPYLLALFAAVGLVLLICCANVANLLLVHAGGRWRELAVAAALGAGRAPLARGLLLESLLLALLGGGLGILLAFAGVRGLLALIPVPLPAWMEIRVDLPALAFCALVAVLASLVIGAMPAAAAARVDLSTVLKEGARGSARGGRLRGLLVVSEVALCLLLLVGAGLMMQSFLRLQGADAGFRSEHLLVVRATAFRQGTRQEKAVQLAQFHQRVLARLRQLPGVVEAGATNSLPFGSLSAERIKADLKVSGRDERELRLLASLAGADVSPGYFEALGIPLLRGRFFDGRDTVDSPMVVIVSERAAERLWPGRDPIGQQVLWGPLDAENPYCTVVGVVGNVKQSKTDDGQGLELYYPYTQYPLASVYYVLRTGGDPLRLAQAVRAVVREHDPQAGIVFTKSMDQLIGESLWQWRLWGVLFTTFAGIALALAAIGLYGLLSYSVAQRRREIGIRMALGSSAGGIARLVVGQGMRLALAGLAVGLAAALAASRLLGSVLYGIGSADPATLAGVGGVLAAVAFAASWLPARRAARVDPLEALQRD